jgi:hypothetical protein
MLDCPLTQTSTASAIASVSLSATPRYLTASSRDAFTRPAELLRVQHRRPLGVGKAPSVQVDTIHGWKFNALVFKLYISNTYGE